MESKGKIMHIHDTKAYGRAELTIPCRYLQQVVALMPQLIFFVNSLNMGLTGEVNIKMHVEEVEYEDMN
jgi:hypothetical protein